MLGEEWYDIMSGGNESKGDGTRKLYLFKIKVVGCICTILLLDCRNEREKQREKRSSKDMKNSREH